MQLDKKQLLSIGGLKLSNRLSVLSDGLIDKYCDALAAFVDALPDIEAQFKKALSGSSGESVLRLLSQLSDTLANIHADELVRQCEKLRDIFNGGGSRDKFEADLAEFLSAVGTLSVDIQMEQHKAEVEPQTPVISVDKPKSVTLGVSVFADNADPERYAAASASAGQRSILAVDDIPVTLSLLKSVLSSAAYKFYGVTSGAAALDFLRERKPDLFILDIEMPNMNGFELAEKIREAGHCAPVVFLTGNTTRDYLRRAIQVGASDFIVKPVNSGSVNAKISKIFQQLDCADKQG
jgi:CheY-like chemotaxis protein/HPt (histidine-containing phosphotransfer) domain-containing protein